MLIKRHKDSHKGLSGKVLVVGGSELYTGAPALCALSALRSGVDLAYVAAPERAANACASNPDLITIPLSGKSLIEEHIPIINEWLKQVDVLCIGTGLGLEEETKKAILKIIQGCTKPIVIDADALKALPGELPVLRDKKVVLTPHRNEFELFNVGTSTEGNAKGFANQHKVVLLLKAPEDIITDGKEVKINKTGNPGMTVGGTGDVLSGIVAGLIAQGMSLFDSAFHGAEICGSAGDLCLEEKGYGFTATDIIEKIPIVMK